MPIHHENPHNQNLNNPPKPTSNHTKFLLFLLKCFIMVFVISLFLVFLGFAAIVLLHFLFITTTFRHRRRRTTFNAGMVRGGPIQEPRVNLPEIVYDSTLSELETRDCAICLEGLREGEVCRSLPTCLHLFHKGCVDNWLMKVPNCPVCRTRVGLGDQRSLIMSDDDWKIWWAVSS
ncbi:hypothetical protein Leryth_012296 [Lithospermum erythrorhizon]|nr:hypothetical protein Leryth_012296 [Lithospermum erythrorhizon]